jgi:hypothetical protein
VRQNYFRLNRRERDLIADIVRQGQAAGEFQEGADPEEFALLLSGLMDGLGVQVTLGQPDVSPERMIGRCLAVASSELRCELRSSGGPVGDADGAQVGEGSHGDRWPARSLIEP